MAIPPRNGIHKGPSFQGGGTPVIKMGEVYKTALVRDAARDRYRLTVDERRRFSVEEGDLLFCRTSLVAEGVGHCALVGAMGESPVFASNLIRVRLDPNLGDSRYWHYYFRSPVGKDQLLSLARGTSVTTITGPDIGGLLVQAPPLEEQRTIAHRLSVIDEKVDLNQRMNDTLEAIGRAVFQSWFVDFAPVRAKASGGNPGMPEAIGALLPDHFEDSELGEVPAGWRPVKLGDIPLELVSGARPRGGAVDTGVPSVGAENVLGLGRYDFSKEKFVPPAFFDQLRERGADVRRGDVLLYKDGAHIGRKTYFDRGFPHEECAINEHVFIIRAAQSSLRRYLFFWLDQDWITGEIVARNSNSAQPGINQSSVRSLPVLMPSDDVIAAFDAVVRPMTDRIFAGCLENRSLVAIRDALLPKLISGQVGIPPVSEVGLSAV